MTGAEVEAEMAEQWVPDLPIDPLPTTLVISGVLYLVGAYMGSPPRREMLSKFRGTREEIERVVSHTFRFLVGL